MALSFNIKSIPSRFSRYKAISDSALRHQVDFKIKQVAEGERLVMWNKLHELTSTWNHYPGFTYKTERNGDELRVTVSTDDEIFYYLDQGTSVRYATMTDDFEPKTSVGSLKSSRGAGGLAYVSTKNPHEGIAARNFFGTLADEREKPFDDNVERMINKVIDDWWNSLG